MSYKITPALTPTDLASTTTLFQAYATALGLDLSFQDFAAELSSLPGKYSPPTGSLLLAKSTSTNEAIGCVGVRPLDSPGVCEMKRLYVSPAGRGSGIGKALAEAIVVEAKRLGYRAMRLDTLASMTSARGLYRSLGFREIEAYYANPLEEVVYLELKLD